MTGNNQTYTASVKKKREEKPAPYVSRYQPQLEAALDRILNREDFSYDLNGDALYQHYRDSYTRMGRQAMEDTVGQAATLTGGYDNSYAQTAGQQVYGGYMQQLNDKIPELYALAMDRYRAEGDALYDQYGLLQGLEAVDYGRYLDDLDWYRQEQNWAMEEAGADAEHQRWLAEFEQSKHQYEQSLQLKQEQQDNEKALAAAKLMADKGDYSLLAAYYGLSPEQLQLLRGDNGHYIYENDDEEEEEEERIQKPPLPSVPKTGFATGSPIRRIAKA